ncbi:MAG TPA: PIN domain-containing protein [Acidimicrobiales bacterium]|nr:PIN domain-containing protein [Acidimicrobiales bacterium]
MSAFVDTNVLVRHLVGNPPKMAARATAYLQRESELLVADLIVAETIYVLESFYEVARPEISEAMRALIVMESVSVVDAPLLLRAVEIYEYDRLDFAEAYLIASAESTGVMQVASFDRSIDRVKSITRVEP